MLCADTSGDKPSWSDMTPQPSSPTASTQSFPIDLSSGKTGPRPADFLISHPQVAAATSSLGAALRDAIGLSPAVIEVIALTVAVKRRSRFGIAVHRNLAASAGVDLAVVDGIIQGRPVPARYRAFAMAHKLTLVVLGTGRVSDAVQKQALEVFDSMGLAEIIAVIGYHDMMALSLAAFDD